MKSISHSSVEDIISDIRQGRMIVLVDDDETSTSEGIVMVAAEYCDAFHVNFMARQARGLVCLALTRDRCEQLELTSMVIGGSEKKPNFTTSIEAAKGIDTGISAADRAHTIQTAVASLASPADIVQPGHVFPLMVASGGVLMRAGLTEAASDYVGLSGLPPAAVISDILSSEGELADKLELSEFANKHQLKIGSIADLINFRLRNEHTIKRIRTGKIETFFGDFNLSVYKDNVIGGTHVALWRGEILAEVATSVRVQVCSTMRDLINCRSLSSRSWSFTQSLKYMSRSSSGVIILVGGQESEQQLLSSIDLSLGLSDFEDSTHIDSSKNIGLGAQILRDLGVGKIRLLSAPIKYNALSGFDLEVVDFVSPIIE